MVKASETRKRYINALREAAIGNLEPSIAFAKKLPEARQVRLLNACNTS